MLENKLPHADNHEAAHQCRLRIFLGPGMNLVEAEAGPRVGGAGRCLPHCAEHANSPVMFQRLARGSV